MKIGIGLPTRAGGLSPEDLRVWADRADRGPFASLATLDRVVAASHEPLVTLASVIGVTSRIRLVASVIIAPTRETTLLARQAASIDALSGGRFSLGVGVGVRRDDYAVTGFAFERRGRRLDEQLPMLRRIWLGEALAGAADRIGAPAARQGGPELLIGGYVPAVARRIAAHGDGFMAPGGGDPDRMAELWRSIEAAWTAAGRAGRPRWLSSTYVALGPAADRQAADYIRAAYAFDPVLAERRLRAIPTTPSAVRDVIRRQAAMGVDELILRPCAPDLRLVDRLADLVGGSPGRATPVDA
ncbi:MAG TPA: LLM class flavin-dependent oxidoreductase [Candidatus Limnocylindrales bacterium]|nr:LLM class flavin-dependent oxidoreductase [Candidatus Limnocylindrales bacterium]